MRREAAIRGWWPWLGVAALSLAVMSCLGLSWFGYRRVDLFHAAFVNACAIRTYEIHWQDKRLYPERFRYDFYFSPVSLALIVVWIEDGPTINLSRTIPLGCATQ